MKAEDIRAFAERSWSRVSAADRDYWAKRYQDAGSAVTVAAGRELFAHAKNVRDDFPGEEYRQNDFEHHVLLKKLIDKAAHVIDLV